MDEHTFDNIGARARQIREYQGKTLDVVAGLMGVSSTYLGRLERGERALDRISLIVDLAAALNVSPNELSGVPLFSPAGQDQAAIDGVRMAVMAASLGCPEGVVTPTTALTYEVNAVVAAMCRCEEQYVGRELPQLIRNLHTAINHGQDVGELLDLAVLLHSQATVAWCRFAAAPVDLCSQAAVLARRAAERRETAESLGLATLSTARVLIMSGAFKMTEAELDAVTVPTGDQTGMELDGFRALRRATIASADRHPGDAEEPLRYATDLAERTGEGTAYSLSFGPLNCGLFRMSGLLEMGDHQRAATIAEGLNPLVGDESRQAYYWADYGRSLARIKGRYDEAATAFLRSERIFPSRVRRDPFARGVIRELCSRVREDALSRDLRGLAYRAGVEGLA